MPDGATLWYLTHPTPQLAPVLDQIADACELMCVYGRAGSLGRGWGAVKFTHPADHAPKGLLRQFAFGFRVGRRRHLGRAVVFGYSSPVALGILLAARVRQLPVFLQSDSNYDLDAKAPGWRRRLKRRLLHLVISRSARVWTVSHANERYWRWYGYTNQVRVPFESVVSLTPGTSAEHVVEVDVTLRPFILYVGRIAEEKAPRDAVEGVAKLRLATGQDVCLVVAGAGDASLLRDLPTWVSWRGAVDHARLARLYAAAAALVVPSHREPYGLVVQEALHHGLPVVASDQVPSARELCDKGWNIYPAGDITALSTALIRALQEPDRWSPTPVADVAGAYLRELSASSRQVSWRS